MSQLKSESTPPAWSVKSSVENVWYFMNSKQKGNISEAKALFEFQKRNIPVALPWGDNERYDMIAEFNGKLNRIQVKTANEELNGSIKCYTRSSKNHTTNKQLLDYQNDVDYFIFYNQTRDLIALVPIEVIGEAKSINLRIEPPKIGQTNLKNFSDYSFENILSG
jgi:hypothetical protein